MCLRVLAPEKWLAPVLGSGRPPLPRPTPRRVALVGERVEDIRAQTGPELQPGGGVGGGGGVLKQEALGERPRGAGVGRRVRKEVHPRPPVFPNPGCGCGSPQGLDGLAQEPAAEEVSRSLVAGVAPGAGAGRAARGAGGRELEGWGRAGGGRQPRGGRLWGGGARTAAPAALSAL